MSILDWTVQEHTIGPGSALVIHNGGNTLEILEATGTVEVRVEGGDFSELPAGLVIYNRDRRFRFCEVKNGSDANPVTFKIYIGTGDLRDNRFTASGVLNVQESDGTSFSDVVAGLAAVEADVAAMSTERSAADWLDMTGYTQASVTVTTVFVTAAQNVGGIDLLFASCDAHNGDAAQVVVNDIPVLTVQNSVAQTMQRLRIPPGLKLSSYNYTGGRVSVVYKVL